MRIAIVSTLYKKIPPRAYGAVERLVHQLTEALVDLGHHVTLFGAGDTQTRARLVSSAPAHLDSLDVPGLRKDMYKALLTGLAFSMQDEFDIIHLHDGFSSLPAAAIARTPVVVTVHSALHENNREIYERLRVPLVSISKNQGSFLSDLDHVGTVLNGLEMGEYEHSYSPGEYLLFVGRLSEVKGVHRAIDVSEKTGIPLIIAGNVEEPEYFNKMIKPRLLGKVTYVGEVDEKKRNHLMANALAFIHPITWDEPFGLTLIESMACGTPVIAIGKGSIPELVKPGTGFICKDVQEMADVARQVKGLDRRKVREYALSNFSAKRMAQDYLNIYQMVISAKKAVGEVAESSEIVGIDKGVEGHKDHRSDRHSGHHAESHA